MCEDDKDMLLRWRNQNHIKAYMFSDNDITPEEHRAWMEKMLLDVTSDYQVIEFQNQPIGLANAVDIDLDKKTCHWGFYLGETTTPKGSGSQLASLMIHHIFDTYEIDTIYGEVFEFNTASLKLHDKFGFTIIDENSKTVLKNNKQEKVFVLSLSRDKWNKSSAGA